METPAKNKVQSDKKTLTNRSKKKGVIGSNLPDLRNNAYFLKKAEKANRLLDKFGMPKNNK